MVGDYTKIVNVKIDKPTRGLSFDVEVMINDFLKSVCESFGDFIKWVCEFDEFIIEEYEKQCPKPAGSRKTKRLRKKRRKAAWRWYYAHELE